MAANEKTADESDLKKKRGRTLCGVYVERGVCVGGGGILKQEQTMNRRGRRRRRGRRKRPTWTDQDDDALEQSHWLLFAFKRVFACSEDRSSAAKERTNERVFVTAKASKGYPPPATTFNSVTGEKGKVSHLACASRSLPRACGVCVCALEPSCKRESDEASVLMITTTSERTNTHTAAAATNHNRERERERKKMLFASISSPPPS